MKIKHFSAKLIKKYRAAAGLTQKQLANKAGMHRTYIIAIETEGSNPTTSTLEGIAKALGCQVMNFYTDKPDKKIK